MASRKSTLHRRRGPRWPPPDAGYAAAGTAAAKPRLRPPPAATEDLSPSPPAALARYRSTLTPGQLRAGIADDIDPHRLAEHERLFGWRRQFAKGWSWS